MKLSVLEQRTQAARELMSEGRAQLTASIREAYADGLSQRAIAEAAQLSQPEVFRLIHFHGTSPLSQKLRKNRSQVLSYLAENGIHNVRVFGSLATGKDHDKSDIDLLATTENPLGLMKISEIESHLSEILQAPVDLVFDHAIRPDLENRILRQAVRL